MDVHQHFQVLWGVQLGMLNSKERKCYRKTHTLGKQGFVPLSAQCHKEGIPSTIVDIHTSQHRGQLWFSFLHTHQQFHFTKIFTVAKRASHLQLFNQGKLVIFILGLLKNKNGFFFLSLSPPPLFTLLLQSQWQLRFMQITFRACS